MLFEKRFKFIENAIALTEDYKLKLKTNEIVE